ncbi:unnamed protein product [Psylliodes chrysocephalus]|uniref:Transposase n=1 Tax=Psylliodes chrysocephalus TaxID=3402493 RepID=A0A9P0CV25_9CUCU|nr:unnamed protein product [Psylliodes chrysocephala]
MGNDNIANRCKRCKKEAKTGLRCIIFGAISHKCCLPSVKNIIYIDSQSINCCSDSSDNNSINSNDSTTSNINIPTNSIDEIKIKYLEEILTQKDLVIKNQEIAIKALQSQVDMLKEVSSVKKNYGEYSNDRTNLSSLPSKNRQDYVITPKAVSSAIHQAETATNCRDIINLTKTEQINKPNFRANSRRKNILIGTIIPSETDSEESSSCIDFQSDDVEVAEEIFKSKSASTCSSQASSSLSNHSLVQSQPQPRIDNFFPTVQVAKQREEIVTQLIAKMICIDLLPISCVENRGFKNLISYLAPTYKVPVAKTIQLRIDAIYEIEKQNLLKELRDIPYMALTTDCWSSRATESYITLTCHYINRNWQHISHNITTEIMEERHTGINLQNKLEEIMNEWGIMEECVSAIVHDNAANIVSATRTLP